MFKFKGGENFYEALYLLKQISLIGFALRFLVNVVAHENGLAVAWSKILL